MYCQFEAIQLLMSKLCSWILHTVTSFFSSWTSLAGWQLCMLLSLTSDC